MGSRSNDAAPPARFYPFDEAFELLRSSLGKPVLTGHIGEMHRELTPLALLWPVALDWYKGVACLGTPYPGDGEILAEGTKLTFLRRGDPEYGDFWKILTGPLEGTSAVFHCQSGFPRDRNRVPSEWGVVATDEPLLNRPDDARQLYEKLVVLLPPNPAQSAL